MTNALDEVTPAMSPEDVLTYLKDNPRFLDQHPKALDYLTPPKAVPEKGIADFQQHMIKRLKADKDEALSTTQTVVEIARANMNNQQRIHNAILLLLEARNFEEFIHTLTMDLAAMLDVDTGVLIVETGGEQIPHIKNAGIRLVPDGTVQNWMQNRDIMMQDNISGIEAIYGGGAALVNSQILLRIGISMDTPPAILAFGSRHSDMFTDDQATDQVLFLARVIERSFRTWLNLPV